MNALDRAITAVFPGWGMRRLEARLLARSYDSLDQTRDRPTPKRQDPGPVQENRQNRQALLNDARDLDRNNAFAHGVFNSIVDNVVGPGIRLEARLATAGGKLRRKQNEEIEAGWSDWARGVDPTGTLSFWQLQRLVERELWLAGEVLVIQSPATDGRRVPLALEVVESERLAAEDSTFGFDGLPNVREGNRVVQGVEFTTSGAIAAYHVYDAHPQDGLAEAKIQRISANRVLHLFHTRRPGEVRGASRTAPCAKSFMALNQYLDFELTKARVSSAFAVMVKRGRGRAGFALPSTGDAADAKDTALNTMGYVSPGMIVPGGPNDGIESVGPSITSTAFDPFVTLIARQIAAGLNVSYEIMTRDFSKHNFSSIRQSFLEDRRHWEPRQNYLIERFCWPIWGWFSSAANLAGVPPFTTLTEKTSRQIEWIPPGWDWVDPLKEKQADALGAKTGFQNVKKIAARHGEDLIENIRALAEAKRVFEEEELPLPEELFGGNTQEAPEDQDEGAETQEGDDAREPERTLVPA